MQGNPWWSVELSARVATGSGASSQRVHRIYLAGLRRYGDCAPLHHACAVHLWRSGDRRRARKHFNVALGKEPEHSGYLTNYANFLVEGEGSSRSRAGRLYQRAFARSAEDETVLCNYGSYLIHCGGRKGLSRAIELYAAAIKKGKEGRLTRLNWRAARLCARSSGWRADLDDVIARLELGFWPRQPDNLLFEAAFLACCFLSRGDPRRRLVLAALGAAVDAERGRAESGASPAWTRPGDMSLSTYTRHSRATRTERAWLGRLEQVLRGARPPSILSRWKSWRASVLTHA